MLEDAFSGISFEELEIKDTIKRAVAELGFTSMTPIQAQAIPMLLEGKDVIGQAQTGTGKTGAFGIPTLNMIDPHNKDLQAVILCPTRELAMQAADDLRSFAKYMHDVKVLPVYGGQDILRQIKGLKGVQIIVGTPGRVMDHMRRHTIKMDQVSMVVLDEADEMLDMGFREDMELILGQIQGQHQTCLFSATMADEILSLTSRFQHNPQLIRVANKELTVERIKQYYYPVKHEFKDLALKRLLSYYRYERSIIFCNTKAKVDDLATQLQEAGFAAEGLHGDLTQKQRDSVMGRFRNGNLTILIATDIAARGIDVDNVEAVFNYDIPLETEYYVHRIGRTGRAGKDGVSHSLCRNIDFRKIRQIEIACHTTMEEKKIPSNEEIKTAGQQVTLNKVFKVLTEGKSGNMIPVVRSFCEENGVTAEAMLAAFLKMEIQDQGEDIEVNLPDPKDKKRSRNRGRGDYQDKHGFSPFGRKGTGFSGRNRYSERYSSEGFDFSQDDQFGEAGSLRKSRNHDDKKRKDKRKQHERSLRAIAKADKAVKDVRRNGSPMHKKRVK